MLARILARSVRARLLVHQSKKYCCQFKPPVGSMPKQRLDCNKYVPKNCFASFVQRGHFHTSPQRYNPIVSTILRQVAKVVGVLVGRYLRNWWKNLPLNKRRIVIDWILKHKWKFINTFALLVASLTFYYYSHIQENPLTKRKRFIAFTPEQFTLLNKLELEAQLQTFNNKLLPNDHKSTRRVALVAKQLLDGNKDIAKIKDHDWSVSVIDDDNTMNAFVLGTGQIFVFSGLLKLCTNDDQLGVILSHEISHAILDHGIENISHAHLVDIIFIGLIAFLWIFLPTDLIASIGTAISRFFLGVTLDKPYSKMLETEADEVGLILAAKACFDVREASAFWYKMAIIEKEASGLTPESVGLDVEFLATHPSHEKRCEHLDSLLANAIQCRSDSGCRELSKVDPRERVKQLHQQIVNEFAQKRQQGLLKIADM